MSHALTSRHRRIAAAATVDKAVLYTTISAGMILARRYLTSRGIDQAFADQYGSPFGRTAAKIYRTETGTEPRKAWSNVHGKWRRVNGFLPADTPVLDKAFVTYKRTAEYVAPAPAAEPSPAEVYVKATAGYAARFEGLTGDHLRALETAHGTEAPTDHIAPLLDTLAAWKQHLDRFEVAVTDADETTTEGLPEGDPRQVAWRAANTGMDAFLKAQAAVHAAYVDWSFDLTGTVEIDDGPLPAAPTVREGCRIPGCDQHWHYDGLCVAQLGELPFDEGSSVPIELTSPEGEAPYIVAYAFDPVSMNVRRQMNTQADAVAFAKALRDAADAVDDAAAHLAA
ncbi:hypothetical protein [Streptomyces sp. 020-2-3H-GM]|uniref:hypothetical protein n=1 Tax=Streptomyces sp. 020-2-3H-GM TaxID=2789258 RepID=UPI00397F4AC7